MDFIALGGTNEVGASSYYINLAGKHFLLDCGKGMLKNNVSYGPDFSVLGRVQDILSLSQIDAVFISHAHYDHIGYLPTFVSQSQNTPVFSTKVSKELGKYLMYDRYSENIQGLQDEILLDQAFSRIHPVGYGRSFNIDEIKVTFFEAGHVPGAAMIYFESPEKNVLYTGDFMEESTKLAPGYQIPPYIKPDVIIMCGLHAKHPYYKPSNMLLNLMPAIAENVDKKVPIYISVQQLTKGIEAIQIIIEKMQEGTLSETEIFVDDYIWTLAERLGTIGIKTLSHKCSRFSGIFCQKLQPGIYIGDKKKGNRFDFNFEASFSLHAQYADCRKLIDRLQPSVVFVVHSPDDKNSYGNRRLERDFPNLQIVYPEQGHKYSDTRQKG